MNFVEHKLSQTRRIMSILMIIFLFVVVMANSNTRPIYYGNKVHLLCTYEKPISGCRFMIPGESLEIQLFEHRNLKSEKYEYFGKGFTAGECGITIYNVTKENGGYATCILRDFNSTEQFETVEIKIFDYSNLHMGLPKMKILSSSPLKVSQTLAAECVVKSTDEYSNISWLLDDTFLSTFTTNKIKHERGKSFELKSILKHQLDTLDNGRTLKCRTRVSNYSQEFVDSTLKLVVLNETSLEEPKIGLPFDISIKFFAYPRVLSSRWRVNKRIIYYGVATSEFISKELKYLGSKQWEAVLHITNVTDSNIHNNYTLQVDDKNGTKYYNVRLDNSIDEEELFEENTQQYEEPTTISVPFININDNTITSSPELHSTKQHHYQQSKGEKSNMFRRRTTTKSSLNSTTIHGTERRTKYTRKPHKNTSISITEMTSVISTTTTTESNTIIVMTKEHTNETTKETGAVDGNSLKNVEYHEENATLREEDELKEFNTTTSKDIIEIITIEDPNETRRRYEASVEQFFIRISFVTMTLIIIIFLFMLCHYRHKVAVLKNEIIQMNLENYYNQSCLYPSTFNDYSSTNFQQNDEAPFYIKRPLDVSSNQYNSSGDSDESSNQLLSTYSTNSHLYQSIDVYDIENHVYDEIVHAKDGDEEKPNNYENNESLTTVKEMLIPSHCHTLMTIHEEEELEASQIQILSNLESTYI